MDSEKCKALICAIEKGNLSDAAVKLGYTPSGMSRIVTAMENELGIRLLTRSRRGVEPTRECTSLLPTIREIAKSGARLEQEVAELEGMITGDIEIGTAYSSYYKLLSGIVRDFGEKYPGIRIGIQEGRSSLLMAGIENGDIDFCVISKRKGNCEWIPLFDDEMVAWVPQNHPAVQKNKYSFKEQTNDPFIMIYPGTETDTTNVLGKYGIKPNTRYTTTDTYAAYSMVEAGLGVTIVNALFADLWNGSVVSLPIAPREVIPIGIAVTEPKNISPAAKRFRDFAVDRLQKLTESI